MSNSDPTLFPLSPLPPGPRAASFGSLKRPLWSHQKARLIAHYLQLFTYVTKHGAYIDGFAGPQAPEEPGSWSAELVLGSEPRRLRTIHLCDESEAQIGHLRDLLGRQPPTPGRKIDLHVGDFNVVIDRILASGTIKPAQATFALLDQRTFECRWETVRKLAAHKPPGAYKIELFYFLPMVWFDRAVDALTRDKNRTLRGWWGRDDWLNYKNARSAQRPQIMTDRFRTELGYAFAHYWKIHSRDDGGRLMYVMIHASDHPEAPKLMYRAYQKATLGVERAKQLSLLTMMGFNGP